MSNERFSACAPTEAQVKHTASFFKVLGDETRLRILYALFEKEQCVGELCDSLAMTKSAISHQLRLLKMDALVKSRRSGKNVFYSLDDQHIFDILQLTQTHIGHKFDA